MGNLTKRLEYITMIGNNMSTLGVPANRIDNRYGDEFEKHAPSGSRLGILKKVSVARDGAISRARTISFQRDLDFIYTQ